ncbi:MAG: permease [Clostridia bacterium]|nr:permease [Clostridia bacterium]
MGNYRNFKLVYYFVAGGTARAERASLEKDIAFFEKYLRPDKVYLEPFRSGIMADEDHVALCREVFEKHGVEVAGGLTTTIPTPEGDEGKQRLFDTFCYNDRKMTDRLKEVCSFLGAHFNEFIIDDFFFTNCTCEACRRERDAFNKARGIADGSWQEYRLHLMETVSRDIIIAPAKAANPDCKITIKYPNWAESYQETGYNPAAQRKLFDRVYTGTEARDTVTTDQHLPRYLSFSLMTYFEAMWPGHNGGGWFDPFDLHLTEQYLEQAYLTAFSKPRELMMFCFQALADNPFIPPLGFHLDKLDAVLDHCGQPVGTVCYLPDNCQGEDNFQDFLGMCGLPVVCSPYWPEKAPSILLTRSSACDPEVVDRLEAYVAAGGKALVTSGFLEATMDRGIQRMTSIRFTGRRVRGRNYRIETADRPRPHLIFPQGREEIGIPVCEFRNNSAWALAKVADTEESFGLLLRDTYGKGQMLTLAAPDSFPDLYKIPAEVLTRIRSEFPSAGVYLECGAGISLFAYDNDAFIVYPYATSQAQPATIRIHAAGDVSALEMPVRKHPMTGEAIRLEPLYSKNGETVFETRTQPGAYELYRILR